MEIIYIIIGIALFSLTIKIIKKIDNNKNENNTNLKIKDGFNFYIGKTLGKLLILIIGIIIAILITLIII